jgi:hypothetical protein
MKTYRHYKGGYYEVITEDARHHETGESFVVYRQIPSGTIYIRPTAEFRGWVDANTKRFASVDEV